MTAAPLRVVSLVPSTTESVVALAGRRHLVGCTRYCTEPRSELAAVPRIGGTKNPSREGVVALAPDLVLGNAEENRPEDLAWFAERVPVLVQTPCTVAEASQCLRELGAALGAPAAAQPYVARIEAQVAAAAERLAGPRLRVFYPIWRKPWMSVNASTYIHDVLRVAGADNVVAAHSARYPEVDVAEILELGVDCVLLPDEPWVFDAAQRDELAVSRLFGDALLALCDGRDHCWHGVRAADGIGRVVARIRALRRERS